MYAAIEGRFYPAYASGDKLTFFAGMITAFEIPELNSFSCTSPLNLNS
jgi:hypothetical protein